VKIGQWVRRVTGKGEPLTKPHLVESVVDDEPFTNCGRRFRKRKTSWFETTDVMPPDACQACQ
jgi:hypothetical protein